MRIVVTLLLGCVGSILIFLLIANVMNIPGWYRIAQNPGTAQGVITSKHPEDRNKVDYSFSVGQHTFSGRGAVGEDFERLNIGDRVRVTYDQQDPNTSILMGSASDIYKQMIVMSAVFAIVMAFPAAFIIAKVLRYFSR